MRNVAVGALAESCGGGATVPPAGRFSKSGVFTGRGSRFRNSGSVGQRFVALPLMLQRAQGGGILNVCGGLILQSILPSSKMGKRKWGMMQGGQHPQ